MQTRTVQEVAKLLHVSAATVYQLCSQRKLAHFRVGTGRGAIRIQQEDLDKYVAAATVQTEEPKSPKPPPIKLKHLKI